MLTFHVNLGQGASITPPGKFLVIIDVLIEKPKNRDVGQREYSEHRRIHEVVDIVARKCHEESMSAERSTVPDIS